MCVLCVLDCLFACAPPCPFLFFVFFSFLLAERADFTAAISDYSESAWETYGGLVEPLTNNISAAIPPIDRLAS